MDRYLMADGRTLGISKATAADRAREEALNWFDELRDPLRRYLMCAGAGPADADEAVQEAFLRLYRHLEKNGDRRNVRGWVFQVARNCIRDQRKSARHQHTVPLDDAIADPQDNPERCAQREERTRRLRGAIEKLPEQERECILLRSSGLRYREIADVMGIDTNRAGQLVQRAVARFREDLS